MTWMIGSILSTFDGEDDDDDDQHNNQGVVGV